MSSADGVVTVNFVGRMWVSVDGMLDNSASIATVDDDTTTAEAASRLRHAGWDVMRTSPERDSLGWPPMDSHMSIAGTRADWRVALAELDGWAVVKQELGKYDSEFWGSVRELIEAELGSGPDPA